MIRGVRRDVEAGDPGFCEKNANIRGACPSLHQPMATGDGLLVRLQLTEPSLTPRQAHGLAEASRRHGNGLMEITARGNIQFRGLRQATLPALASDLDSLCIGHNPGPAVMIGPLAGIDPQERSDPLPLAAKLRVIAGQLNLHPKTSLIVEGGGQFSLDALSADIRISAASHGRWQIALAGAGHDAVPLGLVRESRVPDAVRHLLLLLQQATPPARMADLLKSYPIAVIRETMAGGGIALETPVPPGRAPNIQTDAYRCQQDTFALLATMPFGQLGWRQMAALADLAATARADLRLAPGRSILLAGLHGSEIAVRRDQLAVLGFIVDRKDPRCRLIACAGAPACGSAHIAARSVALSVLPHMPARGIVHVSGCAKGCAYSGPARLTLLGLPGGQIAAGSGHPRRMKVDEALLYSPAEVGRALAAIPANEEETS